MVSDRREFIRLDVGYFDNPKVADALDESPLAPLLHIASMAYARQHRTDGVVPIKRILRKVGATENDARILLEAGLWTSVGSGSIRVHDYDKHQETKAQIEARTNAAKKANQVRWSGNQIPIGSEPDSEPDPIGNPEERRGEERRTSSGGVRKSSTERVARADEPPPLSPTEITQSQMLLDAGLPPWMEEDFFQALKDGGAKNTTAMVIGLHRKGLLQARVEEWQTERDRAAKAPKVLTANVTKTKRGADGAPVFELCGHDFEVGRCPECRALEAS